MSVAFSLESFVTVAECKSVAQRLSYTYQMHANIKKKIELYQNLEIRWIAYISN